MNLSFFIAKRYLVSKKSHNAINIISGISVIGVCIGTMALVIVLSAFNGLSDLVQSLYNSFNSDIRITVREGKTFDPTTPEFQTLKKLDGVVYFNEALEENALLKFNDQQCLATVKGVGDEFMAMTRFDTLVRDGSFILKKDNQSYTVIGKGISYLLSAGTGDVFSPISIYAPKRGISSSINPEDAFNEKKTYISGIFSLNDEFDYKYVLLPIDFTRELLGYKNQVSAIEIGLKPNANQEKIQKEIEHLLGNKYVVKNKYQQNELLFKTLKSEKLWTSLILVFILIIATFNVIGSLTMLILDKKKDIAILWDMGAGAQQIRRIFLIEGVLITFIGAALGLLLGAFTCWLQIKYGLITFDAGYIVDRYPVNMELLDFAMVLLVVMAIGLFAAWYPVRVFTKKYLLKDVE